ncbi:MAG TPA: class I SAM-dependent methyltransferase [Solirubrobacteraceae bacterium]|jgi:SAM-dependent methyltransferase|nr:class I SAM-dependent methyltransferase [Solirubrobacteraceae bacterium]
MRGASSNSLDRAFALLAQGPLAPPPPVTVTQRLRVRLRASMLRALRPLSVYQHMVDEAVIRTLAYQHDQIERLELFVTDLMAGEDVLQSRTNGLQNGGLQARPYVAGDPFGTLQTPVGEVTGYTVSPIAAGGDTAYAGFEDIFRGPAERVTDLQRPYLPLVADHQPVLDLGCGRGEFLVLLAEEGITASGVDGDPGMVQRCRSQGLPVVLGDGLDHLAGLEDGSLGTLFCAQVIEHLTLNDLHRLLELSLRKLAPGGLLIAETINPHNLAAMKTFWVDVTHRHPIFPETALALCAAAGFAPAYVFAPGYAEFEAARYASSSYAVVASAPAA